MKIEKIKKRKVYKCNFRHTDPNGREVVLFIGEENNCATKAELVAEIKRIKEEIDNFPLDSENIKEEIEEVVLTDKEVQEIEDLVLA